MRLGSLAAIFLLLAASGAGATVYKVVGPDGKVHYTDQPLSSAASNVHVFKAGTARPTRAPEPAQPAAAADVDVFGLSTKDGLLDAPGVRGAKPVLLRPENAPLLPAMRDVLTWSVRVREIMQMCMQAQPAQTRRYESVMEGWKTRNQDVLDATEEVLNTTLAPVTRIQLKQYLLDRTRQTLRPMREGPLKDRIVWCEARAAEIERSRLDPAKDAGLAQLLRAQRR